MLTNKIAAFAGPVPASSLRGNRICGAICIIMRFLRRYVISYADRLSLWQQARQNSAVVIKHDGDVVLKNYYNGKYLPLTRSTDFGILLAVDSNKENKSCQ